MMDLVLPYWEVVKNNWQVIIGVYVVVRLLESLARYILKRVFGIVYGPLQATKNILVRVSVFDWILITLLGICFAIIAYMAIMLMG